MKRALPIFAFILAVGCVKMKVQQTDDVARPIRSPDSVTVLDAKPEQPYTVIAVVESSSEEVYRSFDDLRQKMIAEAAQLGGDALILAPESTKTNVIFVPYPIFYDKKQLTGEVIVFDHQ